MTPNETPKYRHLVRQYCYGCGIDLGSGGDPVVPWAWQLELPPDEYAAYNNNEPCRGPVNIRGSAFDRFAEDNSLNFIYCSHLLEDRLKEDWPSIMTEWSKALKVGGVLIILVPEVERWAAAINAGQTPNCAHKYEPRLGDLSAVAEQIGLEIIIEGFTDVTDGDYSLLGVFRKTH